MITAFEVTRINERWHVTAFVDANGNKHLPIEKNPLPVGEPILWYLNLSRRMLSIYECWRCGADRLQLRGLDHNDCGGCETCDQHFGGLRVCSNSACEESKEREKLDPEGVGYLGSKW